MLNRLQTSQRHASTGPDTTTNYRPSVWCAPSFTQHAPDQEKSTARACSKRAKISHRPDNNQKHNIWEAVEINFGTNKTTLCPDPQVNKQQDRPSALGFRSSNNSNKSNRLRLWRTEFMWFWITVIYNMRWQPSWDKLQSSLIISREGGGNDGSHYVQKFNNIIKRENQKQRSNIMACSERTHCVVLLELSWLLSSKQSCKCPASETQPCIV